MPISAIYEAILRIALAEFADIVVYGGIQRLQTGDPHKLRLHLIDDSFIDIYLSPSNRYSYHWEVALLAVKRYIGTIMLLIRHGAM